MIKKINSLTKVFIKSFYQNMKIFNRKHEKIDKKSIFFWSIFIISIAIFYASYKIINMLIRVGQPNIFINIYFLILFILLTFQTILISTNIYFFSKDIEYILPMPIKSIELFLAKFNTILSITYATEALFGIIPLIIYGLMTHMFIKYFILFPIVLLIFPVLIVSVISILTLILMNLSKIIKNENFLQVVITFFLVIVMFIIESYITNQISDINNYTNNIVEENQIDGNVIAEQYSKMTGKFLIINPSIEILNKETNILKIGFNILKLILYNITAFLILILLGKRNYIKNVLREIVNIKRHKKKKIKMKDKRNINIDIEYIKKELKNLFRHPIFFIQTILPVIIIIISTINIGIFIIFLIEIVSRSDNSIREALSNINFDFEMSCIILCALQVLFSISGISLTAISRDGRDAMFMKYIPIDLYRQFVLKNLIQVSLNLIISMTILGIIYYLLPFIGIVNILAMFVSALFINLINSYLMLTVDILRPNLNWDSEYTVVKNNQNKIFQYVLMILIILFLMYMSKLFKNINIGISTGLLIEGLIFFIMFIVINILIRKNINKLFSKII